MFAPFGKDLGWFVKRGYHVPRYDVVSVRQKTLEAPNWLHFGAGNIFRAFVARIAESLLNAELIDTGLIAVESFDYDVVDLAYTPLENFSVVVEIREDGSWEKSLICSVAAALKADPGFDRDWLKLRAHFTNPSLEVVTFTVTEKAYVLNETVRRDAERGPQLPGTLLTKVCSLLHDRYLAGLPLTLLSLDNFKNNSEQLKRGLIEVADIWARKGFIARDFADYVETTLDFPVTVIDKIVPAPAVEVRDRLREDGLDFVIHTTEKGTKVAGFVNAEYYQYLVIEKRGKVDKFDHGDVLRNVFVTSRDEVEKFENMKVSACLNPVHTATAILGVLLGYHRMHEAISDRLIKNVAYGVAREAMAVIDGPSFVDPNVFLEEVIERRISNPYVPDSPFRIATDTSQKFPVRFGPTLVKYCAEGSGCNGLKYVPLVIASWLRYLIGVDDDGEPFTPSPDPELERLRSKLDGVELGAVTDQLRRRISSAVGEILSYSHVFGLDLSNSPLREKIESTFLSMLASNGSVRKVLEIYMDKPWTTEQQK